MTKAEFKEKLIEVSAAGGFPARSPEGGCQYRTADGRKCAVGVTIPDGEYRREMECGTALDLYMKFPDLTRYIPEGMSVGDMDEVQGVHDMLAVTMAGREWPHAKFAEMIAALPCFSA